MVKTKDRIMRPISVALFLVLIVLGCSDDDGPVTPPPPSPGTGKEVKLPAHFDADIAVFVDGNLGDDRSSGLPDAPQKTISNAMATARDRGRSYVCVAQGTYEESIDLAPGVSVVGGFSREEGWRRDSEEFKTTVVGSKVRGLATGLMAVDIKLSTCVDGFEFAAIDGSSSGESVYSAYVLRSDSLLTIQNCSFYAGKGSAGSNGTAGNPGSTGGGAAGGPGGVAPPVPSAGYRCSCKNGNPGENGGGCGGIPGGTGGTPLNCVGRWGLCGCSEGTAGDGMDGFPGGTGAPGQGGIGGKSVSLGGLVIWNTTAGAQGETGACGTGGGGGGSTCSDRTLLGGLRTGAANGGDGGAGGGGGGSFGVFVVESRCNLVNLKVFGGTGGAGGSGGVGGSGGSPSSGEPGQHKSRDDSDWEGGRGGDGGLGGPGGPGGGGAGGPSYCMFIVGDAEPFLSEKNEYEIGAAGVGGPGGGPNGNPGANGVADAIGR